MYSSQEAGEKYSVYGQIYKLLCCFQITEMGSKYSPPSPLCSILLDGQTSHLPLLPRIEIVHTLNMLVMFGSAKPVSAVPGSRSSKANNTTTYLVH